VCSARTHTVDHAQNESRVVRGVAFAKNVAHKRMKRQVAAPRVLLVGCAIEFARQANKLVGAHE
jgi:chaperonin GroEL (HSP60 family)